MFLLYSIHENHIVQIFDTWDKTGVTVSSLVEQLHLDSNVSFTLSLLYYITMVTVNHPTCKTPSGFLTFLKNKHFVDFQIKYIHVDRINQTIKQLFGRLYK